MRAPRDDRGPWPRCPPRCRRQPSETPAHGLARRRARGTRPRTRLSTTSCGSLQRLPLQRCGEAGVPASARRSHRSDSNPDFRADMSCAIVSKKAGPGHTRTAMKLTAVFTALAVAAGCVTQAHAQAYPSHPVTIIVPFPAGGPSDTLARILGERMRVSLGQPVIVETVTGAGASIGVVRAAQSAPDGYTLSIGNWTSHVGSGAMYPAAHDALAELAPVSLISATPLMIVGRNE